mgnify:CR=1 FL=1
MPAMRKVSLADAKKANRSAILAEFADYGKGMTPEDAFVDQIDCMMGGSIRTPYDAIYDWVRGGGVLVYNEDIQKYLKETQGIVNDPDYFDKYCRIMARDGMDLYLSIKESQARAKPKPASAPSRQNNRKQTAGRKACTKQTAKRRC